MPLREDADVKIPRAIKSASERKQQKPPVELGIDPAEAWIRWASELHLSPRFDRYAYDVAFLTHLVGLIGEQPEHIEDDALVVEVETDPADTRVLFQGTGNWKGVEAKHIASWLRILNLTRAAGADILGWHRSSVIKVLTRERHVTEAQSVRFLEVLARLDDWQRLQYVAMVKGLG
jgi:hypothetical protein